MFGHTTFYSEFKLEAVRKITERGYCVAEKLGVSVHSLYKWLRSIKLEKMNVRSTGTLLQKWNACFRGVHLLDAKRKLGTVVIIIRCRSPSLRICSNRQYFGSPRAYDQRHTSFPKAAER
ncbi:TPA: transposase [Serratia marcescens]|uniref:transposase n=1 Tax=Serratia marcescens TaxID=615 RepID=UPI0023BAE627|nr:transposase [Serratia marcescens]